MQNPDSPHHDTAPELPNERVGEHKLSIRPPNSSDPNPINSPWNMLEQVRSIEAPEQVCSGVVSVSSTWMSGLKASQQNIALWPNGRCCYLHLSEAFHCTEGFLDSLPTADRKPYMFQSPPSCMWIFLSNRTEVLVETLGFSQVHRFIKLWVEGRRCVMSSLLLEKSLEVFPFLHPVSPLQLINFLTNPFRLSPFNSVANSVNKKLNPCCECGANNL